MVSIRLEGDVERLLRRMQKIRDTDKRGLNTALGETLRESTIGRFESQEDPEGKKWPKSKRVIENGGVTLSKTGRLSGSIHSKATAEGFAVGTNTIYAGTHQNGMKNKRITIKAKTPRGLVFKVNGKWVRKKQVRVTINIPKRAFLGISDADNREVKATVDEFFMEE
ncbi:phage virion morphogenesis protein [Oscillospiraceae bacterium OttesenSCG-928-F05]|nr:phage virion morphogenesis protein [Oscillospiraceae bacterium OttesenSCG-928-F05]